MENKKKEIIQIKNPKTGRYLKIDCKVGMIVSHKKTDGPYKNIPIGKKNKKFMLNDLNKGITK